MASNLTRIAAVTLAGTLVGCILAPRGAGPTLPGSGPILTSAADPALPPVKVDSVAFDTGDARTARVAYVTVLVGARRVQEIPGNTKVMAIKIATPGGANLLKSAKCGSADCYKDQLKSAVFLYSGSAVSVTLEVSMTELPITKAVVRAFAYKQSTVEEILADTQTIATGSTAVFDLEFGKVAGVAVSMTPDPNLAVSKPELTSFFPTIGGPGQSIQITGKFGLFQQGSSKVKFGAVEAIGPLWATDSISAKVPEAPEASTSVDGKAITVENAAGSTASANLFTFVSSISVDLATISLGPNTSKTVLSGALDSARVAIAGGANVLWTIQAVVAPGPTPTPGGSATPGPTPDPKASSTPAPADTSTPAPAASATPALDVTKAHLEWGAGPTKKGVNTGEDYPKSVTVHGGASAGLYELGAKTGSLQATQAVEVK